MLTRHRCLGAAALALTCALPAPAQDGLGPRRPRDPVPAPSLEGGVAWINTRAPVTLEALRGKVVLLDFWTFG